MAQTSNNVLQNADFSFHNSIYGVYQTWVILTSLYLTIICLFAGYITWPVCCERFTAPVKPG